MLWVCILKAMISVCRMRPLWVEAKAQVALSTEMPILAKEGH